MAGDKGRFWRYKNGHTDLVLSNDTLANTVVWARSANEVYMLGVTIFPSATRVYKWDGSQITRLPDLPRWVSSISATPDYLYSGGYRFDGTQWQLMPGNAAAGNFSNYPTSESFIVLTAENRLYLFDGQTIRPIWAGERLPGITGTAVFGNEIYLSTGQPFILHGRPE
jgi:hypothetical protein